MSAYGAVTGGTLAIIGAALPWLTLDGGLQRYNGTIGPYGWLIVAAGALIIAIGLLQIRKRFARFTATAAALGIGLFVFAIWLLSGVQQVVHRPEAAMFAPGPGPGLFVVLAGAIVVICAAAAQGIRAAAR
jgi:hypothetical protein